MLKNGTVKLEEITAEMACKKGKHTTCRYRHAHIYTHRVRSCIMSIQGRLTICKETDSQIHVKYI